ncbi:MAG: glycine cleavage system protein H [Verrucomicrobia bacterium]|nr:MAG: glycine cleavage system protein H [Verrucomicrobiota bacterium]
MANVPLDFKYSPNHEWIFIGDDETVLIGITDYAQESLGDILFLELPLDDTEFKKGETWGVIESVNGMLNLSAPLSGIVLEVNPDIESNPELLNEDPYQTGWLIHLQLTNPQELDKLMAPQEYEKLVK